MFSIFKKPKHKRIDDQIYINRKLADEAFIKEYNKLLTEKTNVFLFCFFEKSIIRLQPFLGNTPQQILNAKKLTKDFDSISTCNSIQQKQNPVFLFAEHHPHLYSEQAVINEIEVLCNGNNPSIGFFTSLDEPLMQQFGSQKIIELMKKLGIKEDEVISNSMVTKSIANAQEKIAKKVGTEIAAKSQEEWMSLNLL